ncbi:MAG: phosphotransferase [Anaerolineales bacterium]|nr:phosphotransferase [Anaerolineales bacterium]
MTPSNSDEQIAAYLARIRPFHLDLAIDDLQVNTEGLVNDVLIVNGAHVFRFPKADWAVAHMRQEAACLTLARRHVAVPLPAWRTYDDEFISYDLIPGVALQRHHVLTGSAAAQHALAAQIGGFLRALHAIPLAEVSAAGIGPSVTNRTRERWLQFYTDVQAQLFPLLMQFSRDWVHHHFAPVVANPDFLAHAPALINGDLGPYHLLYNPDTGLLNGIIDFGTAGTGDPAVDFACLLDQYGETFVRRVARHYPGFDARLLDRARFWAGTLQLQWLLGGLRNPDDPSWFAVHVGRARDVLPVGAGWEKMHDDETR